MSNSRFRLTWARLPSTAARWRLGLVAGFERPGKRAHGIALSLRGLLLWSGACAVLLYLAAATALAIWLDQRPYNTVTWVDCLLAPVRRDELRRKRGQAYIQEGLAALEAARYHDALLKLQAGLARVPDDRRTRQRLASFYLAMNARPRALAVLQAGLAFGYPGRDYIEFALLIARAGDDHAFAEAVLDQALGQEDTAARRDRPWLSEQKAQVLLQAGRAADALAWVDGLAAPTDHSRETAVLALLDLRRTDQAMQRLREWEATAGATEQVLRLTVRVAREAGHLELMRERLEQLRRLAPAQPHAYVYGVVQERMAGETERAAELLEDFLFRFGATTARLRLAADPLAQVGDRRLLDRVLVTAREQGLLDWSLLALDVQLALKEQDWSRAKAGLAEFKAKQSSASSPEQDAWHVLTLRAVAAAESELEGVQLDFLEHSNRLNLSLPGVLGLIELMQAADREPTALQLAEIGLRRFPNSARLQAHRRALAASVQERLPVVSVEVVTEPSAPGISVAEPGAGNGEPAPPEGADPVLSAAARVSPAGFTAVWNRLSAEGRWSDLRRLLREIRAERPTWLAGYEDTLHAREIELLLQLNDLPALVATVRLRLDGSNARGLEAMKLVARLDAAGQPELARLIVNEILQRQPDFPPALRQKRAWEADHPPEAGTLPPAP